MESPAYKGLTQQQVAASRAANGANTFNMKEDRVFFHVAKEVVLEPMFILLLIACIIYFLLGEYEEGCIMLISIFIVAGISFYQEYRSRNAVEALRKLSAPKAKVMRDGVEKEIATEEIVTGDILLLEEGEIVSADGLILSAKDFSLNESILTGESFPVSKSADNQSNVYKGTLVNSGAAIVEVAAVGNNTMFGKIGLSLSEIKPVATPLQMQIKSFVARMVWFGAFAFLLVVLYHFFDTRNFFYSLLQGLTLAMSVLPEEIPVAFSTFQALGAYRLLNNKIIVKQPQYVETLGSATVICADKTGTLTQNKMSIAKIYDARLNRIIDEKNQRSPVVEYAMWASETEPFDPMEKAIHDEYSKLTAEDKRSFYKQVHEYAIGGKPPMMTHVFMNEEGDRIIAAKGAPEAILQQTNLSGDAIAKIEEQSLAFAREGYRVLAVGKAVWHKDFYPAAQQEFPFVFLGLIAFNDPPKENIRETLDKFHKAGIKVKMITGDYAETAISIARQTGLSSNGYECITGTEILHMSPAELQKKVSHVNIFARMFPEAKLRVIDALKENGEVVAMTGDGVNDGPALKAAHIGIAMGQRGSEVAKSAASLILIDDDLAHMTEAVALGRKIYNNLKKAIRYIVSIHIPIILIVTLPLLLQWRFQDIFTPVHVIFLELIMGPTCSIIYENEPMEPDTMLQPPRKLRNTFFTAKQLWISIIQGTFITVGCLGIGYYYMQSSDIILVRTVIFITLLLSNVFLTLVNRSFEYPVFVTIKYKNYLVPLITCITLLFITALLYIPFMRGLFLLQQPVPATLVQCMTVAFICTCWIDLLKIRRKKNTDSSD